MSTPADPHRAKLLADYLEAYVAGDLEAIERACEDHPELCEEIRAMAHSMGELSSIVAAPSRSRDGDVAALPRIEGFEMLRRLGRGGMGVVYAARDVLLDREVAIKVLAGVLESSSAQERFRREARTLAQIQHPHIVSILQTGLTADGQLFYAMELIPGESLSVVLNRLAGRQPSQLEAADLQPGRGADETRHRSSYVEAVVRLLAKIAEGLDQAHALDVVHRDVKPANIVLDDLGEPKLVDFGIAWVADEVTLTRQGAVVGTPAYMAPEQIPGAEGEIGPHTDVFALGVTLFELLTLQVPFGGESTSAVFRETLRREPVRPTLLNEMVPRDLETICLKALDKDAGHRYPTAGALAEDLRGLLEMRPIRARPVGRCRRMARNVRTNPRSRIIAVLATVTVLILVGAYFFARHVEARNVLDAARRGVISWKRELDAFERRERGHMAALDHVREYYMTDREVWELAEEGQRLRRARERLLEGTRRVSELLARAVEHHPRNTQILRHRKVVDTEFGKQVFLDDWNEPVSVEHSRSQTVVFRGVPPEIEVHAFRYDVLARLRSGGEHRLVPAPCASNSAAALTDLDASLVGRTVLVVEKVATGSNAAAAGIERGDLITRIDGRLAGESVYVFALEPWSIADRKQISVLDLVERVEDVAVRGEYDLERAYSEIAPGGVLFPVIRHEGGRVQAAVRRRGGFGADLGSAVGLPERVMNALVPAPGWVVEVFSQGNVHNVHIEGETGLSVRRTAYPLLLSNRSLIGRGNVKFLATPGSYLFLLRGPGKEDQRLPVLVEADEADLEQEIRISVEMLDAGTSPEGYVYVPGGRSIVGGDPQAGWRTPKMIADQAAYWISRTEVTLREYEEFLADPEVLVRIESGEMKDLVPFVHKQQDIKTGAIWRKGADGLYHPLDFAGNTWRPDWPVYGITWRAATEFARWRTRKRGDGFDYVLPRSDEWEKAARGVDGRHFPWGNFLHPHFLSWARARRGEMRPEPVLRFCKDASPYGVRNMSGGVLEWCLEEGRSPGSRIWRGSGFFDDNPVHARCATRLEGATSRPGTHDGFRLVAHRTKRN
jgi:serine/threonine protein kinase/formylglycine-generating enzyme required for sulfatase activity